MLYWCVKKKTLISFKSQNFTCFTVFNELQPTHASSKFQRALNRKPAVVLLTRITTTSNVFSTSLKRLYFSQRGPSIKTRTPALNIKSYPIPTLICRTAFLLLDQGILKREFITPFKYVTRVKAETIVFQ